MKEGLPLPYSLLIFHIDHGVPEFSSSFMPLQVFHKFYYTTIDVLSISLDPSEVPIDLLFALASPPTTDLSINDHLSVATRKGTYSIYNPHSIYKFPNYHHSSSRYCSFISTCSFYS